MASLFDGNHRRLGDRCRVREFLLAEKVFLTRFPKSRHDISRLEGTTEVRPIMHRIPPGHLLTVTPSGIVSVVKRLQSGRIC